jgi:hypothetical protein
VIVREDITRNPLEQKLGAVPVDAVALDDEADQRS